MSLSGMVEIPPQDDGRRIEMLVIYTVKLTMIET
jgi:hypothetical protein